MRNKMVLNILTMTWMLQTSATALAIQPPAPAPKGSTIACEKDMSFAAWVEGVKQEALSQGITLATFKSALSYIKIDSDVLARDRSQGVFQLPFLDFSDKMISASRVKKGVELITSTNKEIFARIEKDFGVPPEPIVAFWALESDFGTFTGKFQVLTSITTLAFDCRRSDMFRAQLISALKIIQRGDLKAQEMIGSWAGEIGGTQLMASDYFASGVDYDKDGQVNLVKSVPDTLASAAQFLVHHGWTRGQPWLQEVRIPREMQWQEADLTIQHPVSQWTAWGVKPARGGLPSQDLPASLLLPMGRLGPAFLAYPNFQVILGWNSSMVYSTTAAFLATRLAGAPAVFRGNGVVKPLTPEQITEVQKELLELGYDPGPIDGKLGTATRVAVKQAQLRLGLPADSYPSIELLQRLKR